MAESLPETKYEVSAFLRLKGTFGKQMKQAAAHAKKMNGRLQRMQQTADRLGSSLMRGPVSALKRMIALLGLMAGGLAVAAFSGLIRGGLAFNKMMEDSKLQLATMFQMFGIADQFTGKNADSAEKWATNIGLAKAAMAEFMVLQVQTPAGASDLVNIYQSAAAGLSMATTNVKEHTRFVADWSVLMGALDGDIKQLGMDLGRVLSGQAESEVRTWKLFNTQILAAGKAAGLVNKEMKMGGKWVESWNRDFTADERFRILQSFIAKTGPSMKKAYGESMGGLLSTTKSTMNSLKGVLTIPMYNEFRKFLKRITKSTSGVFGEEAMREWIHILSYFGAIMGDSASKWLKTIEDGAAHIRENWMEISNQVYKSFQLGAFLIKAVIAKMIAQMAIGVAAKGAAGIAGIGRGVGRTAKGVGGFLGRRAKVRAIGVRRGQMGAGGKGLSGMLGGLLKKTIGKPSDLGILKGFDRAMVGIMAGFSTLLTVVIPLAAALAVVGTALAIVGVIVAGMAVYITENWRRIAKEISAAMKDGSLKIRGLLEAAFKLWAGLRAVGAMFLGNGETVGFLNGVLGSMVTVLNMVTNSIIFFLEAGMKVAHWFGDMSNMMGKMSETFADSEAFFAQYGLGSQETADRWYASAKESYANAEAADNMEMQLGDIRRNFRAFALRKLPQNEQSKIDKTMKSISEWFDSISGAGGKKAKVPVSGVHVENMYNQWDLRNTDPDRLMSVFLPKLEKLADKRSQSWEQLDEGV